jgi:SM-20-related protein
MQNTIETLLDDIAEKEWGIIPNFLPTKILKMLKQGLLAKQQQGLFKQAAVGKAGETQIQTQIRGDETLWWQEQHLNEPQKQYYQNINTLREALNQAFFLGLQEFECHYACYPIGAYYQKHLDSFRKSNSRLISCILYLNEDWLPENGGTLRIYNNDNQYFTEILPTFGTLVCMRSDTVWHEVLPATRLRYSITGWLRRSELL